MKGRSVVSVFLTLFLATGCSFQPPKHMYQGQKLSNNDIAAVSRFGKVIDGEGNLKAGGVTVLEIDEISVFPSADQLNLKYGNGTTHMYILPGEHKFLFNYRTIFGESASAMSYYQYQAESSFKVEKGKKYLPVAVVDYNEMKIWVALKDLGSDYPEECFSDKYAMNHVAGVDPAILEEVESRLKCDRWLPN